MIRLEHVYALAGLMFAAISILNLRDRSNPKRFKTALFWALVAASFLFGARLGDFVFFGEDIFIAMSSILLIRGVLEHSGVMVEPLHLSVWAIPTAVAALAIHGARLLLLDRRLARTLAAQGPAEDAE